MAIEINHTETMGPNVKSFLGAQPTPFCFIPICLYSFMANAPFLREYLPWVISRCNKPKIIIGDYMERHNIMIFEALSELDASNKAEKQGNKIMKTIEKILISHKMNNNVQLCSSRDITDTPECQDIMLTIRDYESTNDDFKKDVTKQISLMLENTKRISLNTIKELNENKLTQLHEYMIEEIAFFISLYNMGYVTEIYPGRDMEMLQRIAKSWYRNFPYDFCERTHISVGLMLDGGTSYALLDDNNDKGDD